MNFEVSSFQIQGARTEQQDRLVTRYCGEGDLITLICDGVGGHADGGWAADMGASAVTGSLMTGLRRPMQGLSKAVEKAIKHAHESVSMLSRDWHPPPATTLVGGVFVDRIERACLFSVGDSYLLRLRPDGAPEFLNPREVGVFLGHHFDGAWIAEHDLRVGDLYLLASDGIEPFLGFLPGAFFSWHTARDVVEFIAEWVLEKSLESQDNITLVGVLVCD